MSISYNTLLIIVVTMFRFRHHNGMFRWMEGTVSNCLTDPTIGALVGNYHDISERKQAEEERDQALGMFTYITEQRRLESRTHEALDALLAIAEALVTVSPVSEVVPALFMTTTLAHRLLELSNVDPGVCPAIEPNCFSINIKPLSI